MVPVSASPMFGSINFYVPLLVDGPPRPEEPLYPVLTRLARQNTKKLGQRAKQPSTLKDMIDVHEIGVVGVESIQEPVVDFDDTL